MDFWLIFMAACIASGMVVASVLLWVGTNALLYGRGMRQQATISIASLGRLLRSIYDDTVGESLPDDLLGLLEKLTGHRPRKSKSDRLDRLILS